jgi:hypothetical protein
MILIKVKSHLNMILIKVLVILIKVLVTLNIINIMLVKIR